LLRRVIEQKKQLESSVVRLADFQYEHASAFKFLNKEWMSTYFKMKEADYRSLDNPQEYILDKGGHILVALHDDKVVGISS